ncbi:MAG TPA: serine hydrolase domain-containing protein, partial [Gemmatimonadales bacterium]|nr:serine hydrolase domain-containing protein [Gemmatimonadales bacterium]
MLLIASVGLWIAASPPGTACPDQLHCLLAPDHLRRRVDQYFAPIVANHDFAGTVLIARGNRILLERGYGSADPELSVATVVTNRYRIASVTKTFTAAAIAILAERGVLHLTDPLSRFLPSFPNGDSISIRQLLGHEAGLANPDYREGLQARIDLVGL